MNKINFTQHLKGRLKVFTGTASSKTLEAWFKKANFDGYRYAKRKRTIVLELE